MSKTGVSKKLNLLDSSMLIMGSMIGSGIFIVSSDIARQVQTPGMLLLVWAVTAVMTIFGALSYGELAAAMPEAGGQYVFLRRIYHELFGFMYGWTVFTVIQTGTIAAVAVAFAKFTGVFVKEISPDVTVFRFGFFSISTQQLLAASCILFLSLANFRAVKSGARLQNLFTFAKVAALLVIIVFGAWAGFTGSGNTAHFSPAWPDTWSLLTIGLFGSAMVGSLFSADAWNNITYIAAEVENPKRNLPLSLLVGTGSVVLIYFFINVVYLYILPISSIQAAEEDRVGTALMNAIAGNYGLYLMAALIMVATFGCLNGIILAGARVYYAMAKDGLFFKSAARLNKNDVPANSLLMQGIWACVLVFSGSYSDLLTYVIFAVLIFYILTVGGVIVLRIKQPELPRPYKTFGYPLLPVIYIVLAVAVCVSLLVLQFGNTWPGLVLVLSGIPVYYVFKAVYGKES